MIPRAPGRAARRPASPPRSRGRDAAGHRREFSLRRRSGSFRRQRPGARPCRAAAISAQKSRSTCAPKTWRGFVPDAPEARMQIARRAAPAGARRAGDHDGKRHRRQPVELFPHRRKDQAVKLGEGALGGADRRPCGAAPARPPSCGVAMRSRKRITSGSPGPQTSAGFPTTRQWRCSWAQHSTSL